MEIKVGLVEPGGEYGVPCGTCDKRAALYLVARRSLPRGAL